MNVVEARGEPWIEKSGRGYDIPLAVGIMGILFVILVPLPPAFVDALLIINITASLMILLTAGWARRPLEFNVFPSLLLIVTFFRLALNVATTRLILGGAQERGLTAAGGVVEAFASFVAGSNVIVGLIIFGIIVVVQFVVITRGTTRISEVAARFTLDAMPGKQLAIDQEFSAGLIPEAEARRRRDELSQETDFFGAMDGASKFVRGEAVASIVITLTNILAGFVLGTLYHSMDVQQAAEVFAKLTVGDGLVSQVPALMVSVATALLITKNSGGEGFGQDIGRQLFGNDRMFFTAAAFLVVLLPSGLPKLWLLTGAGACVAVGYSLRGRETAALVDQPLEVEPPPSADDESPHEKVRSLLVLEPIELEIGYRLVRLVDQSQQGNLMSRLSSVRERIALDLGLVVPPVKVRDNTRLHPGEYTVKLRGSSVGHWKVYPSKSFVVTEGEDLDFLDGVPGADPSTGYDGLWVDPEGASQAARAGYVVRRVPEIVTDHLERLIRLHAAEILTREEVSRLVNDLRDRAPALVEELIPSVLKVGEVHKVLQNLLHEQVGIRNLELILEALADSAEETRDPQQLTERVRVVLSRTICSRLSTRDGVLHAALLDPTLEEFLQAAADGGEHGRRLDIEPQMAETLIEGIERIFEDMEKLKLPAVLVCSGTIRSKLHAFLVRKRPLVSVLAYEEAVNGGSLQVHGTVTLEEVR